jgi:hypothetical protein
MKACEVLLAAGCKPSAVEMLELEESLVAYCEVLGSAR